MDIESDKKPSQADNMEIEDTAVSKPSGKCNENTDESEVIQPDVAGPSSPPTHDLCATVVQSSDDGDRKEGAGEEYEDTSEMKTELTDAKNMKTKLESSIKKASESGESATEHVLNTQKQDKPFAGTPNPQAVVDNKMAIETPQPTGDKSSTPLSSNKPHTSSQSPTETQTPGSIASQPTTQHQQPELQRLPQPLPQPKPHMLAHPPHTQQAYYPTPHQYPQQSYPHGVQPVVSLQNPAPIIPGNFYLVELSAQCFKCQKWRTFITSEVMSAADYATRKWCCEMSPDPATNRCDAPQQMVIANEVKAPNGPWNFPTLGLSTFDRTHYEKYFSLEGWTLDETLALLNFAIVHGCEDWESVSSKDNINHTSKECKARFWHIHTLSKIFVQSYIETAKRSASTLEAVQKVAQYEAKIDLGIKAKAQMHRQNRAGRPRG
ncbi:hypothetical protein AAMO2058_001076700 [Amorphochlora amoebiformis]